jgi:hypothetical protein
MINMINWDLNKDWEVLHQDRKDAFRDTDSPVNMDTRL